MSLSRISMAALFLFFVGLAITSEADPNYLYHICSNTTTFTPNSTYQKNLNLLLSSLASSSSNNGFHNTSIGQTPDTVYGLFLCRGDLSTAICQDCVTFATQDVVRLCPVEKLTVIWYDECLLRYSNRSYFGNVRNNSVILYHTLTSPFPSSYQDLVRAMVNDQASQISNSTEKFGIGATNFPSSSRTLYTLAQCTHDLSTINCQACLQFAIEQLPNGPVGARTLNPSCIIRYETYLFYNASYLSPPPPLSPSPLPLYLSPPAPSPLPLYLSPPASAKGNF